MVSFVQVSIPNLCTHFSLMRATCAVLIGRSNGKMEVRGSCCCRLSEPRKAAHRKRRRLHVRIESASVGCNDVALRKRLAGVAQLIPGMSGNIASVSDATNQLTN
jgi:hypothetical protein